MKPLPKEPEDEKKKKAKMAKGNLIDGHQKELNVLWSVGFIVVFSLLQLTKPTKETISQ